MSIFGCHCRARIWTKTASARLLVGLLAIFIFFPTCFSCCCSSHYLPSPPSPLCLLTTDASLRHSQNVCFLFVAAVTTGLAGDKELSVVTFAIGLPQRFYLVCTCFFQPVDYFISKLHAILFSHIQKKKKSGLPTHSVSWVLACIQYTGMFNVWKKVSSYDSSRRNIVEEYGNLLYI